MRAYTDETAAEVRALCAGAIEIDVGDEGAVIAVRPFDQTGAERWINEGVRSVEDANANAVTRQLIWPTVSELDGLRRRYALLDEEVVNEMARDAGHLGSLAVDKLVEDTPAGVLERAGLSAADVDAARAAAGGRRGLAVIVANYGPDKPRFACVVASPREGDLIAVQSTTDDAKRARAQALRTLALGCVLWTNEGPADKAFERRPLLPIALYPELRRIGGDGAVRARKRGGGHDTGAAAGP